MCPLQVLFNREELPLTELCGGPACSLSQLRDHVLRPFLVTREQHASECSATFLHDLPAGEHVAMQERREVSVGSGFSEEEAGEEE